MHAFDEQVRYACACELLRDKSLSRDAGRTLAAAANVRRSSTTLGRICYETPVNDRDVRIVSDGLGDPRSMAAPAGAEGVRSSAPKIEELAMMCLGFRRRWPGHLLVTAVRSPVGHVAELSHAATARGSAYDSAVCSYDSAPRRYDSARRRYDSAPRRYDSAPRRYDSARAVLERRLRSEAQRRPVAAPLPRSATHGSKSATARREGHCVNALGALGRRRTLAHRASGRALSQCAKRRASEARLTAVALRTANRVQTQAATRAGRTRREHTPNAPSDTGNAR